MADPLWTEIRRGYHREESGVKINLVEGKKTNTNHSIISKACVSKACVTDKLEEDMDFAMLLFYLHYKHNSTSVKW